MKQNPSPRYWPFDVSVADGRPWWSGPNGTTNRWAACAYLFLSLGPLLWFSYFGICEAWLSKPGAARFLLVVYGIILSIAPHIWLWRESAAFFYWSSQKYAEPQLKEERERFKLHADFAKAIWATVVVLYAGALLKYGA